MSKSELKWKMSSEYDPMDLSLALRHIDNSLQFSTAVRSKAEHLKKVLDGSSISALPKKDLHSLIEMLGNELRGLARDLDLSKAHLKELERAEGYLK
jgi:hemerythrin superfamily protein